MDQDKIGKLIKEIRTKNNLTQKEFADKYGVTYQAVSKWENAKNMPDVSLLRQICIDFDINMDELFGRKYKKNNNKKYIIIVSVIFIIVLMIIGYYKHLNHDNFEFKTLTSDCSNFNITGSIAYNNSKSSIYISSVNYCGGNDNKLYTSIDCTLYEVSNNIELKLDTYSYSDKIEISLEEFLKNVTFNIDSYSKVCSEYNKDNLYLLINAKDINNEVTSYKVPLLLNDNCSKKKD